MALGNILPPGYRAYKAVQAQNEQGEMQDLQKAQVVQGMLAKLQAQKQEEAFRGDVAGLGGAPTQEQLAQVAARHTRDPQALLDIQQKSLDRQATLGANAEAAKARLAQAAQSAEMVHEFRMSRAATDEARAAETARHNKALEAIQAQNANLNMQFKQMGIDIQQQGLDLRRDIQWQKTDKLATEKETSVNSISASMDRLAQEANRMLTHPGLSKSTGLRSWLPLAGGIATVPGTDAANFKAGLETLKSQAGFSVLQAMRDASKTGGALGQVSDFENKMLQANLAALDTAQSEEEFKAALGKIITYTEQAKERLRQSAKAEPGAATPAVSDGPPPGVPAELWNEMTPQERAAWKK